jgi:hypothetical protein
MTGWSCTEWPGGEPCPRPATIFRYSDGGWRRAVCTQCALRLQRPGSNFRPIGREPIEGEPTLRDAAVDLVLSLLLMAQEKIEQWRCK